MMAWRLDCSALVFACLTTYASKRNIPIAFVAQKVNIFINISIFYHVLSSVA